MVRGVLGVFHLEDSGMIEAPKRIWLDWKPGIAVTNGPLAGPPRAEYVRADLSDALIAAAIQPYQDVISDSTGVVGYHLNGDVADWNEFDLPATLYDARADLDRMIEEAVKEKLRSLGPLATLLVDAKAEAEKAMRKFPQPNYVISKWAEETGEVTKAAIHYAEDRDTAEHVIEEITQSLAMLHRLIVEGDEVHGFKPIAEAIRARGEKGDE